MVYLYMYMYIYIYIRVLFGRPTPANPAKHGQSARFEATAVLTQGSADRR